MAGGGSSARQAARRNPTVPVLLYSRVAADAFARQMTLLDHAGYDTIEPSFDLVFAQDRPGFATPGAPNPLGRIEITPAVPDEQLRARLG